MSDFISDSIFKEAFLRASRHYIEALELPELHSKRSSDTNSVIDSAACINNRMLQSFAADLTEQLKMQLAVMTLKAGTVNFQKYCLI